jgi:TonB family protein
VTHPAPVSGPRANRDDMSAAPRCLVFLIASVIALLAGCAAPSSPATTTSSPAGSAARAKAYDASNVDRQPVPKFMARPQYPAVMREQRISGEVVVDFIVDTNGDVQNAYAHRASHREFEAPAVAAVEKWKFAPGMKNGRAVPTHMQVPIQFSLNEPVVAPAAASPGVSFEIPTTPVPADTHDISQLDVMPVARFQARPQYPFALRRANIEGEAVTEFIVDTQGNVQRAYALRATHPEFADAAVAAVSKWKFKPGMKNGRTVNTRMQVPIVFTLNAR